MIHNISQIIYDLKSDWLLVPDPIQLCPLKGTVFERKNKVNFFKAFDNSFSKYLIFKRISLRPMAVLGYSAKLKRGLGLAFGAHFLHDFFIKMFLI